MTGTNPSGKRERASMSMGRQCGYGCRPGQAAQRCDPGPITTVPSRSYRVWVPAFAGTTSFVVRRLRPHFLALEDDVADDEQHDRAGDQADDLRPGDQHA